MYIICGVVCNSKKGKEIYRLIENFSGIFIQELGVEIVHTTRGKETHLGVKVNHNKRDRVLDGNCKGHPVPSKTNFRKNGNKIFL